MKEIVSTTLESALLALPAILDWLVDTTAPVATAVGGVPVQVLYGGLAVLSTQLWRLNAGLAGSSGKQIQSGRTHTSIARRFAAVALLFGALLFGLPQISPAKETTNPGSDPRTSIEASLSVPAPIEKILNNACKDCHSNETRWPRYAKFAPISWMLTGDVARARRALNLSEWSMQAAKPARAIGYLTAACADVESKRMPPAAYRWLHVDARLGRDQVDSLCEWTAAQSVRIRAETKLRKAPIRESAGNLEHPAAAPSRAN